MEKVRPNCSVTIRYVMNTQLPQGVVKKGREEVIEFIFGIERQPFTLERAVEGACVGDRFSIEVPSAEIYGEKDPSLIIEIPRKGLISQRLKQGQFYRQMKMGSLVSFRVLEIRADSVLADFNKPMAGISVLLDGEIMAIREASKEEIVAARETQARKRIGCG
jgi:FKBP-type peptidyl-prolyl cis-trans isomerase SlyD